MKKRTLSIIMAALILATTSTTAFAASTGEAPSAVYSTQATVSNSGLIFNKTSITLGVGETFDINSNSSTTVYSSANSSVATVRAGGGLVTAKAPGTVVITGVAKDGRIATCTVTVKNAPTSVSLNKTSLTMGIGETYDLNSSLPSGQGSYHITYTGNNDKVATVKKAGGIVTAKSVGTMTVTATTYNGKNVTCKITVKNAPTDVSLNKTSLTMGIGETYDLNSSLPTGQAAHSIVYTSDNTSVVSVKAAGGYVTANKAGTATITATTYNGKKVTCKITVKEAPTSVGLNKTSLTLGVGETYDLNSSLPAGQAAHSIVYTSDNTSVVSVKAAGGYVTANKAGTATITATTYNGKTVQCKITVKNAPTSVNLNQTSLTLGIGETYDLNSSLPTGQAAHSIVYTSNNTAVASVKAAGGYVTANKAGTATITATTYNGKTVQCKITVKNAPTSVNLNRTSLTLGVGETYDLNSSLPTGQAAHSIVYTSDNPEVASVKAAGGLVTANKGGTATITATTYNGKTVTCTVTVTEIPTEPTTPTDPAEPTQPTDPTAPTDPTIPTDPTQPTDPTEPTSPTVTKEVPMYAYQYKTICYTCGEDITDNVTEHGRNHMLNGENSSYGNEPIWTYYSADGWSGEWLVENKEAGNTEDILCDDGTTKKAWRVGLEEAKEEAADIINGLVWSGTGEYEYRTRYTVQCFSCDSTLMDKITATDTATLEEAKKLWEKHQAEHQAKGERSDGGYFTNQVVVKITTTELTWHEAVYEYIEHPAVTEEVWVVDQAAYTCQLPRPKL